MLHLGAPWPVGAECLGLDREEASAALELTSVESGLAARPKIAAGSEPTVQYRIASARDQQVAVKKANARRYAQYKGNLLTKG